MDDNKPAETPPVLDQIPPAAPPPSVQTPTNVTNQPAQESTGSLVKYKGSGIKSKLPIILVVVLLLIILTAVGVFFWKNIIVNNEPAPTPEETPIVEEVTPEPTPVSASTSASFNDFLDNLSNTVKNEDFDAIISLQRIDEIECDPTSEGIVQAICEGASKGEIKTGYWLGRNQGEGSILPKTEYTNEIKNLLDLYAPFTIVGEKESGNRALIVFRGKPVQGTDTMIAFQAKNEGGWKISTVVYGPLTPEYESFDPELFNF